MTVTIPAPTGSYVLKFDFYDAHDTSPPAFHLLVNGNSTQARLPAGKGSPPPYERVDERLTVTLPVMADRGSVAVRITSVEGSWAAPARISLVDGKRFNPAKAGFILVTNTGFQIALALAALGGAFLFVALREGPREAVIALSLLAMSVAMSAVAGELGFRVYLKINPQGRYPQTVEGEAPKAPTAGEHNYGPGDIQEPVYDPDIPYRLRNNLNGMFLGKRLTSNEFGMRGPAVNLEKSPQSIRTMGLGDSFQFGWGVADGETALDRIAERIAAVTGRPTEPLNLGVPSYNPAVEVAVYRKIGRAFHPDIVVMMLTDNDFGFPYIMLEPVWLLTLEKSYLAERMRREFAFRWDGAPREKNRDHLTMSEVGRAMDSEARGGVPDERSRWIKRVRDHYYRMTGKDAVATKFKELGAMLREDGALGIVIYADSDFKTGRPDTYGEAGDFVVKAAHDAGLLGMRMAKIYDSYLLARGSPKIGDLLWISKDDVHPNAIAHKMIGDAAFEELERNGALARIGKRPSSGG